MKLLFFVLLAISSYAAPAQGVTYITLKQEKPGYTPTDIYISGVVDDRADKNVIGTISAGAGKAGPLELKGGAASAIQAFINSGSQDRAKQPAELHIQDIHVVIKKSGAQWSITANVALAFYSGNKKTMEYTGKAEGKVSNDPAGYVEKFIRQNVEADIKKYNTWWQGNKGKVVTNPKVRVNVTVSKTTDRPNCIAYTLQRPLTYSDFTGPARGQELELAETLSGIAVRYTGETRNSQTVLDIVVTPYFDRKQSWMKDRGRTAHVLAHEQTHYDITAIKACELALALRNAIYTEHNYEQVIQNLQKQNAEAANAEENRYDEETNHGIITDKQLMWQNKVTEDVKAIGCF